MRTVKDLIDEAQHRPNYKGRKPPKPIESGPLRENKPLVYNAKSVPNPVINKELADVLKNNNKPDPWVPEYE